MTWILFSLLAPVFFSITSILDKYTVDKVSKGVYDFLFYSSFIELFFSAIIYLFFDINFSALSFLAVLSGIILVFATFFYVKALEKTDVSLVIPLFNTMPIFLLLISYFIFGKTITGIQFISFLIILFGAIIISTESNFIKKFSINKVFYIMLLASFLYAILFSISDFVVEKTNVATVAFFEGIGFFLGSAFFLFFENSKKEIILGLKDFSTKKNLLFLGNNIFDKLGMVTTYKAFYSAPNPAFVSVIGGIQSFIVLFFTIILGLFFPKIIKEEFEIKIFIQKFIGMIIIFIGIYLLYLN